MKLKLITFDITNTVLRFSKPPPIYYKEVAALHGIALDNNRVQNSFNENFREQSKNFPNFGVDSKGWRCWWSDVIKMTITGSCENKVTPPTLSSISDNLIKLFTTSEPYEIVPGFLPLVNSLSDQGLIVGALSNTDERLRDVLIDIGLFQYFQFVHTSYKAKALKPHPRIFQSAIEQCSISVSPSEALHIGDNLHLDYFGARQANWNSVLVSSNCYEQCDKAGVKIEPQFMVPSLDHLSKLLQEYSNV